MSWKLGSVSFQEFLFLAKVAIILTKFSQIWLQTIYELQNFNHPSIFLAIK
jgi:hypothetical protein